MSWSWSWELGAYGGALTGWLCAILTRVLSLWTVSGSVKNVTASLPAYWDGVWLQWDHWDVAHDGGLHCSFYQALLSLSGSFRTWRALIMAAIITAALAVLVGAVGLIWFPKRGQIKVLSGAVFIVSAVLMLVPTAWTCHHTSQPLEGPVTSQPLEGPVRLQRRWGPALYLGWISFGLMMGGGVFLTTRWNAGHTPEEPGDTVPGAPNMEDESSHPLNRINRTAFTNSQYERRSQTN